MCTNWFNVQWGLLALNQPVQVEVWGAAQMASAVSTTDFFWRAVLPAGVAALPTVGFSGLCRRRHLAMEVQTC